MGDFTDSKYVGVLCKGVDARELKVHSASFTWRWTTSRLALASAAARRQAGSLSLSLSLPLPPLVSGIPVHARGHELASSNSRADVREWELLRRIS